ncbi:hypothetical protein FQB35_04645 [Crassaminicella thermophila]|uniref:Haemolysin XhlA n=1 Tax=Crassaminicella thermophila TaxID=2599308 RepID=A0A5C0SCN4_CRATE|nr:hemolysin XhlA family protein [Crassaminicella thermophila]QEK11707.1 hypothetical protein FQB35_04645 [Crassaminicella thermophila]
MNNDIIQEILERIVRIETKIDGYNNLREKLDTTHNKAMNNEQRIKKIEDSQTWLWRTFVGALIVGFIATSIKWK